MLINEWQPLFAHGFHIVENMQEFHLLNYQNNGLEIQLETKCQIFLLKLTDL